jgi:hypothetical protein
MHRNDCEAGFAEALFPCRQGQALCRGGEAVVVAAVRKFSNDLFDQPGMLGLGQLGHGSGDGRASYGADDEGFRIGMAGELHVEDETGVAEAGSLGSPYLPRSPVCSLSRRCTLSR